MYWPEIFAKSFLILITATLLNRFLYKQSASLRHFICFLSLLAIGMFPLVGKLSPQWNFRILPHNYDSARITKAVESVVLSRSQEASTRRFEKPRQTEAQAAVTSYGTVSAQPAQPVKQPRAEPGFDWRIASIKWIWLTGFIITCAPLVIGTILVRASNSNSSPIHCKDTLKLVDALCVEMEISPVAQVRLSHINAMPIAWGWWRPIILLPSTFASQTNEEKELVLRHELAHIKRKDCLTQTIAWLICCIHWFNPLAWMAVRDMRIHRERACDDLVLRYGSKPSAYADYLLKIARLFSSPRSIAVAAIAIAKPSQLEGRLLAILEPTQKRAIVAPRHALIAIALTVSLVVPLAGCHTTAKQLARLPANPLKPMFDLRRDYKTGTGPCYLAAEDFDGDSRPDIVIANGPFEASGSTDYTISILRNITAVNGDLTFAEKIDLPGGAYPLGIETTDLDSDGKLDIAMPCHHGNYVLLYRNVSLAGNLTTHSFSEPLIVPTLRGPQSIALKDLNGDRKPDMVVANNGSGRGNTISIFENVSSPGKLEFGSRIDIVTGTQPTGVVIDDFDNDGWADIAVANHLSKTVSVLPNHNRGEHITFNSFRQKFDYVVADESNYPIRILSGDLDQDGRPDLVIGNHTDTVGITSYVALLHNLSSPGQIAYEERIDIEVGLTGAGCPTLGDLNNDGWTDLVVGNHHGNTVTVLINAGAKNTFGADLYRPKYSINVGSGAANPAIADLDRDGKADIIVPNKYENSISVLQAKR